MIFKQIKCKGVGCPLTDKCARYDPDPIQRCCGNSNYREHPFRIDQDGKFSCDLFMGGELEILKYNMKKRIGD